MYLASARRVLAMSSTMPETRDLRPFASSRWTLMAMN